MVLKHGPWTEFTMTGERRHVLVYGRHSRQCICCARSTALPTGGLPQRKHEMSVTVQNVHATLICHWCGAYEDAGRCYMDKVMWQR